MDNEKELTQLKNRLRDLADKAYQQDIFTYTVFLNMAEMDIYYQLERELSYSHPQVFGGHDMAERCMIRFGDPEKTGYDAEFPIQCIHISPATPKFAEKLTHRDFLGALMNLGIERQTIGDILVNEKEAWVFASEKISEYICENLDKVRHNNVRCHIVTDTPDMPKTLTRTINIQVASLRADSVIAKTFNLSRETSLSLFKSSCVYINGRLTENNSKSLLGGEIISVRGYGKFLVSESKTATRKGKLQVAVQLYC